MTDAPSIAFTTTKALLAMRATAGRPVLKLTPAPKAYLKGIFGQSLQGTVAGTFTIVNAAPDPGDGQNGDGRLVASTGEVFYKQAGTWDSIGKIAILVTDSQVTFETPTAGPGTAELATA